MVLPEANYDEARVPAYILPDPLRMEDGTPVKTGRDWQEKRRPELLALFEREMFGQAPGRAEGMWAEVLEKPSPGPAGSLRKQVRLHFSRDLGSPFMDLLLYLPAKAAGPVPAFLGLNFKGNHAVQPDPEICLGQAWQPGGTALAARGSEAGRWDVPAILESGFGLVTACYNDIDPDFDDGFKNGVQPLFDGPGPRPGHAWGAIGAWAWGLSRALDYLESEPALDAARVALIGHSRLGKAALWAGAADQRFALVVSNNSGCGGAALSRRCFGETLAHINTTFPHWFCANFRKYNHNEAGLPFDQHQLLALIAPRPLYVASAAGDLWADPRGEFLAARQAGPVYSLLGARGLDGEEMPQPGQAAGAGQVAYHLRPGSHDLTAWDWRHYLEFAQHHL